MENNGTKIQVQMIWPEQLLDSLPAYEIPSGYL
jgi:hypothetical protein